MDQHLDTAVRPGLRAVDGPADAPDLELENALLRDAAAVLSARQYLDSLVAELAAQPFLPAVYRGLRAYLSGPADRAQAAYQRVCASTTGRDA